MDHRCTSVCSYTGCKLELLKSILNTCFFIKCLQMSFSFIAARVLVCRVLSWLRLPMTLMVSTQSSPTGTFLQIWIFYFTFFIPILDFANNKKK